jgi:hypothetical protein
MSSAADGAASAAPAAAGVWGNAQEVPGLTALNTGGDAWVISVSCPAAGECAASGRYAGLASGGTFVASEDNGVWGTAQMIPGLAGLAATGSNGGVLSCPSAGNCAIGGSYSDASGKQQAFVADETDGIWGTAIEVPGLGSLNSDGEAGIASLSCASPGNCAAAGSYTDGADHLQAFVVSEVGGTWGPAAEVPGTAALNTGGRAQADSVSCASPGNCAAGGYYTDISAPQQAFVVDETDGTWGTAQPVPGTAALNAGRRANLNSVSCASPGNCTAGGYYTDGSAAQQAFVVDETGRTWGTAAGVPGMNSIASVSCASAGNCTAAGGVRITSSDHAYVVDETNGTWGTAAEIPGMSQLPDSDGSEARTVSCTASGHCAVGGDYAYPGGSSVVTLQPFVADKADGTWHSAQAVPGAAALNVENFALINSVSCASAEYCSAGGFYYDSSGASQAFIVNETPPASPSAVAVGVEGPGSAMWVQAPQLGGGWHSLGGQLAAPPAVAAPPNPNGATPAQPLFIATSTNKLLYIRSPSTGWQQLGPVRGTCLGGPAAVITGGTLTVACRGTNNALWENSAPLPASGLPRFSGAWTSLGGVLTAAPAVAPVGGVLTFFARNTNGHIYTRTLASGFRQMPWACTGTPAAALQAASGVTFFACQGTNRALLEASNADTGWTPTVSLGGLLIGGPAVAATSRAAEFLVEGSNGAVWERTTASGWSSLGGTVVGGVGATALN